MQNVNFEQRTQHDANCIHDQIAPQEGVAEYQPDEFDAAKLVNPIGLIEFADLDGIGDYEAGDHQPPRGRAAKDHAQNQENRYRPQSVTDIIYIEVGQILWDEAAGQAKQKQGGNRQ